MIRSRSRLATVVARLGLFVSLTVAIAVPAGYLAVVHAQLNYQLSLLAELKANKLAKYVYVHRELWQYHTLRIAELTEIAEAKEVAAQQRIFDAAGKLVLETGEAPDVPVARWREPVVVAGGRVATIETAASLRPLLIDTGLVAVFSSLLGFVIFYVIRILPLRTIDRTLADLAASQSRYRNVVDSMIDAVFTSDPGGVTYVSAAASRVLGLPPERIVGAPPASLFDPEDVPLLIDGLREAHRTPGSVQTVRLRSGGQLAAGRWLELRFLTTGTPDGRGRAPMTGVVRDIHAQVLMERAQRDDMLKLRSIVESSGVLIALVDNRQRIVLANRTFLEAARKTLDEVIGVRYDEVVDCREAGAALTAWLGGTQGEVFAFDHMLPGDGARRVVRVTASHVHDEDGRINYTLFLGVDETDRRSAEVRAIDAGRLASLGEMATGIAHEITQPLTVIQFAADSLQADIEDGLHGEDPAAYAAEALRKMERLKNQVLRASGIVRRLQGFARGGGDDVAAPFDIAEAIRGAADLVGEQMRLARIAVELDLPPDLPPLVGQANRLQQVLINLMINARDAIVDGRDRGSEPARQERIDIRAAHEPAAGRLVIELGDSGPGIPPHVMPRLFESFFTTKPKGKGTGLGLSISTEIMTEMGGSITAQNRPGGGALFRMSFPVIAESKAAAA